MEFKERLQEGEKRRLVVHESGIDFASNDYLGFARCPQLKQKFLQKMEKIPLMGASASRLITGNSHYCEALELKIATYHGEESGLLFVSGYTANLALLTSLATRDDWIFYDKQVHASMRDGIILSGAKHCSFRHNDLNHLEVLLQRKGPSYVCIESIYSTDGSIAPLKEIASLCTTYSAKLLVDEAHATGVFGGGLVSQLKVPTFARVHTFGKALGVQGGIILCSHSLRSHLITTARPFIYTTALSYPTLCAIDAAYELLEATTHQLPALCNHFNLSTPIHTVTLKSAENVLLAAQFLKQEGFIVGALRYPTVPRGQERLRICLHTFNSKEEIKALYALLDRYRD